MQISFAYFFAKPSSITLGTRLFVESKKSRKSSCMYETCSLKKSKKLYSKTTFFRVYKENLFKKFFKKHFVKDQVIPFFETHFFFYTRLLYAIFTLMTYNIHERYIKMFRKYHILKRSLKTINYSTRRYCQNNFI